MDPDKRLPFPTRMLKVQGGMVEEYIIPDDRREEVLRRLSEAKIIVSLRDGAIRASAHLYNNEEDIEGLVEALPQ